MRMRRGATPELNHVRCLRTNVTFRLRSGVATRRAALLVLVSVGLIPRLPSRAAPRRQRRVGIHFIPSRAQTGRGRGRGRGRPHSAKHILSPVLSAYQSGRRETVKTVFPKWRTHHPAEAGYVFSGWDIALRCPRRVQRRNCFECQRCLDIHSARYYAGGDGAARHPYHRAKHIRSRVLVKASQPV